MELDQDVVQEEAIQWKEWLIEHSWKQLTGKVQVLCLFPKFFRTLSKQGSQKWLKNEEVVNCINSYWEV